MRNIEGPRREDEDSNPETILGNTGHLNDPELVKAIEKQRESARLKQRKKELMLMEHRTDEEQAEFLEIEKALGKGKK